MKTSTKVLVASGFSALFLGVGMFLYMNVSNVETSTAGTAANRIIPAVTPLTEIEVKSTVLLPVDQQPIGRNSQGIMNKRKANILTQ